MFTFELRNIIEKQLVGGQMLSESALEIGKTGGSNKTKDST